ncbi:MAG: MupA/Atu3671 family FMN-dependent luciferase-like monooxygenase [Ilumatobacteraceae bacterium]
MKPLRCALIGADTLLRECAQTLLDRGHTIVSVAAGSERVASWATGAGLEVHAVDDLNQFAESVRSNSVDYLFAITHLRLLPSSVLAAASRMAINFHDGPLPGYAGLNTPVWGILRGEAEWGVTWHRIDEGIDTGDVLVQRRFAITDRETSLSLNTRNFEEALDSFGDLLDLIEADNLVPVAQQCNEPTTTFRRDERPDGVLDLTQSASDVDRVVRALHFGPHPNPVAAAVLWNQVAAVIVGTSDVVEQATNSTPGTVLAASDDGLTVSCADGAIVLGDLRWIDSSSCSASDYLDAIGSGVGKVLPQLGADQRRWFADFRSIHARREATTIATLAGLSAADFPWPHGQHDAAKTARSTVSVPDSGSYTPEAVISALAALLVRLAPDGGVHVALAQPPVPEFARQLICTEAPLDLAAELPTDLNTLSWSRELLARTPQLAGRAELATGLGLPIGIRLSRDDSPLPQAIVVLQPSVDAGGWEIEFASSTVDEREVVEFARCLSITAAAVGDDTVSPSAIPLLRADARRRVLDEWNATDVSYESACTHELIARQAAETPGRQAVICGDDKLTYQQLTARSERLAAHLQQTGVVPDSLVGVHVDRGVDLIVAVLAVLQAGGAYVPLDPAYPADRLRHMIADSGTRVIVCNESHRARLPLPEDGVERAVVGVDSQVPVIAMQATDVQPHNLAYCIYTSGSAGVPKAVMVEHRNVANLFTAMDNIVSHGEDDTWCAVTSLSFDISVVELLYTLARGIRVALYAPDGQHQHARRKPMDFSLFYFSADETDAGSANDGEKYRLLLEGARFADTNDFCAVWTPERHFHAFGGLYPNPAITAAAISSVTKRISIRAGSVVLPLHHPVEIAEAWSMVDNLSNGRAGVSFASGWQPNDFVLRPQNYARAKAAMYEGIEQVRRLWRGESLHFDGPNGAPVSVATLPRPVQAELPMWITTAGNPESFAAAGSAGTNLLTHLVGQSIDQLTAKIAVYRAARAAAGHDPATGVVTLMMHTFVGDVETVVRSKVREPLRKYLSTSFELLREHAWSFPTFRRPDGSPVGNPDDLADADIAGLTGDDLDAVLDFAADRYYETSGLFGTPEQLVPLVGRLHEIGVDEIACLVDFGVATDDVLANLPHLTRVRELLADEAATEETSIAELVASSNTTHIQCTPSMARVFTHDPAMRTALGSVRQLLVGGEELPSDLAHELQSLVGGTVVNMYGPTETTVWSSSWQVQANFGWTPIGTPLANTQLYVLDNVGQPTPPGVAGQLWIGGAGVARGYHQRPELTAERFAPDPFRADGRMYSTGDLARWHAQPDGSAVLQFLGRADQQVKLRGHRVELGEIEAELRRLADVDDCAAIVRDDEHLVAYVATRSASFNSQAARDMLRQRLPEVMVPGQIVVLPTLPRTPNGKLDRRALPTQAVAPRVEIVPATSAIEHQILSDWQNVLGNLSIGIDDNFFDVGGHSLLVVRLHRRLQETLGRVIAMTDLYRFPTVRTFTASLAAGGKKSDSIESALDRAARRRASARSRS